MEKLHWGLGSWRESGRLQGAGCVSLERFFPSLSLSFYTCRLAGLGQVRLPVLAQRCNLRGPGMHTSVPGCHHTHPSPPHASSHSPQQTHPQVLGALPLKYSQHSTTSHHPLLVPAQPPPPSPGRCLAPTSLPAFTFTPAVVLLHRSQGDSFQT